MAAAPVVPQRGAAERNAAQKVDRQSVGAGMNLESLAGMGGTSISMDMQFQVQGLDGTVFRQKIQECRKDFESIVRRVVEEMQHQKTRTAYAQ